MKKLSGESQLVTAFANAGPHATLSGLKTSLHQHFQSSNWPFVIRFHRSKLELSATDKKREMDPVTVKRHGLFVDTLGTFSNVRSCPRNKGLVTMVT